IHRNNLPVCVRRYAAILGGMPQGRALHRSGFGAGAFREPAAWCRRSHYRPPCNNAIYRSPTSRNSGLDRRSRSWERRVAANRGLILALYTYKSGLRAPAMIAFVKDFMIYITVIAAVILIPVRLGGYGAIFEAASSFLAAKGGASGLYLKPAQMLPFASLA